MIVGSILHGAYGDYYEQLVGLRWLKQQEPTARIVLFYASGHRMEEMRVFDLSFADEILPVSEIERTRVDRFYQYQVQDPELRQDVLEKLKPETLVKIGPDAQRLPWTDIRDIWKRSPALCDLPLSGLGRERLPACMSENRIDTDLFERMPTVGFLWRYRVSGGAVSPRGQRPMQELLDLTSQVLGTLIREHGVHVLVCGMAVETTEENIHRVDRKFTNRGLDLPETSITYLRGLSWGLELETMRHCTACLTMPSGFSEALWFKRNGAGLVLYEPPLHYVLKLLRHRMPLFDAKSPAKVFSYLRTRRTAADVLASLIASDRTHRLTQQGAARPTQSPQATHSPLARRR